MKRIIYTLLCLLGLYSCEAVPENPTIDAFGWQRLTADQPADSAQLMGLTDLEGFLREVADFPWLEQALLANQIGEISPTLSADDLLTDHSFFISSGSSPSGDDFGYFVGFIHPERDNGKPYRQVDTYIVDQMSSLRKLATLFFARDYRTLQQKLAEHPILLQNPERISWTEYLTLKQTYITPK